MDGSEGVSTAVPEPETGYDSRHFYLEGLDSLVARVIEHIKTRAAEPELPTGIGLLDQQIWGLTRAGVTVIAARPGEGKTSLALQIGRNLADKGKRVVFISLEMTKEQLVERMLVQFTQCSAWDLRTGRHMESFLQRLEAIKPILPHFHFRVVDDKGKSITEVKALLQFIKQESPHMPDVLIIDFIQLVRTDETQKKWDAIEHYLNELKDIAKSYNIAILVCSQLNREATKTKKGRPSLAHLKSSGAIEEMADCVILCWWEELGTEEKPEGYRYWLIVGKQRYGPPGAVIAVRFEKDKLTFHAVEDTFQDWNDNGSEQTTADVAVE